MSLRTCIACGELIHEGSRCTDCKPSRQRNGWAWTQTRQAHLARHPTCVECGTTDNVEVHHINGNPDDNRGVNLETRCKPHHDTVTYKRT